MNDIISAIKQVSHQCGEQDVFLQWRLSMLAYAEALPKENKEKFSYGLGIISAIPHAKVFGISESPYSYKWGEAPTGVSIMSWNDVMKDSVFSAKIFSLFEAQKQTLSSNYFFALSAALFSDGLVVLVDKGVSADIILETKIPASGADTLIVFAGVHSRVAVHETFSFETDSTITPKLNLLDRLICFELPLEKANCTDSEIFDMIKDFFIKNKDKVIGDV